VVPVIRGNFFPKVKVHHQPAAKESKTAPPSLLKDKRKKI
jgi:hypothetical protein